MKTPRRWWWAILLWGLTCATVHAGSLTWTPGGSVPVLEIQLGDGVVKRTLDLASGVVYLDLILKKAMAPSHRMVITWSNNGKLWMSQYKKIPDVQGVVRMPLPPGPSITLEVTTDAGAPMAVIKLRRN